MNQILTDEVKTALSDSRTLKILGTVGENGLPHLAFKDSLTLRTDGLLEYNELIETSEANRNMVKAIWFDQTVAISLLTSEKQSFLIHGKVIRAIISGQEFKDRYLVARQKNPDTDLSTVWIIEPFAVREETLDHRKSEEEQAHPLLQHLDRLLS